MSPTSSMDYLNPSAHIDEERLKADLIHPLEQFLCSVDRQKSGETPEKVMEEISAMNDLPTQCGKMFRLGEPTYSCRDCGHDLTCVLCIDCFKQSEHQNHRYKMSTSLGGGYCDCGDAEAWSSDVHCAKHILGTTQTNQDPLSKLPDGVKKRALPLFTAVLSYVYEMLTLDSQLSLPSDLTFRKAGESSGDSSDMDFSVDGMGKGMANDNYATVVYNDEVHTFDEVINTLPRAVDCDRDMAIAFATMIDREGRVLLKCSGFTACNEVKNITERITSRRGGNPLKVAVMHGHVVAHQSFAIRLLVWMQSVLDKSVGFRALFSNIMFDKSEPSAKISRLESFLRHDVCLWKAARGHFHQLIVHGMLLENETKRQFSEVFTRCYGPIIKDFINDDHEHTFSVTSLSVQIFTVPKLANHLIAHCDVLANLMRTFMSECERKKNAKGKLEFHRNLNLQNFKRASYILYDMKYVLTTPPTESEWTDELRRGFLHGVSMLMNILMLVQGMDAQVRQSNHHVEYELEWEAGFNLHVKLAPIYGLVVNWCKTDRIVFIKTVRMIFKKLHEDADPDLKYYETKVNDSVANCLDYQVSSKPVSFHQPLTRMLAALALHMKQFDLDFDANEFDIPEKPSILNMIEPSMRIAVLIAQVQGGMWRRNGYSVVEQVRDRFF